MSADLDHDFAHVDYDPEAKLWRLSVAHELQAGPDGRLLGWLDFTDAYKAKQDAERNPVASAARRP
jgi:hypothetical protein